MAKITVQLSAKEFYTGETDVELPIGIDEDMIEGVEPDGYGEFCVFLNEEGQDIIEKIMERDGLTWTEWGNWSKLESVTLDINWLFIRYPGNNPWLKNRGEAMMEFCEVEGSFVDHWEVEEGPAKVCDCEHKFDIAYCDQTCLKGQEDG